MGCHRTCLGLQNLSGFHAIAFTPFRSHASHFRETSEGLGSSSSGQSATSEGGTQNNLRGDGLEVESCARLYCNVKICTYVRVYTGQFTQTHERA